MKYLTLSLMLASILAVSSLASAEGGKNSNPWQNVEPETCAVFEPEGLEDCTSNGVVQSGQAYLCEVLVVCPTEEDED